MDIRYAPERAASVTLITRDLASRYGDPTLDCRREELSQLVLTAGGQVVEEFVQERRSPDPATFIGSGKASEIAEAVDDLAIDMVVFNHELSPGQQTNLEAMMGVKVIDRTRLILDIFAQRARSKEGKIQVELAQLSYLLPRLTGMGEALSRLAGGIGTRGPGETKLEADRRRVRRKMSDLKQQIREIRSHRQRMRDKRQSRAVPLFALVGYTNSGKSTLMNRLTGADQLAEDRLFATLDPLVRKMELSRSYEACLVDTVGFVRDLPDQLMAAFRATLEELNEANYLLHVVDISHPDWPEQVNAVIEVLTGLNVMDKEMITVLNKVDRIEGPPDPGLIRNLPRPVTVSALHGRGIDPLVDAMTHVVQQHRVHETFDIPYSHMEVVNELHQHGEVHREEYGREGVQLEVSVDWALAERTRSLLRELHRIK